MGCRQLRCVIRAANTTFRFSIFCIALSDQWSCCKQCWSPRRSCIEYAVTCGIKRATSDSMSQPILTCSGTGSGPNGLRDQVRGCDSRVHQWAGTNFFSYGRQSGRDDARVSAYQQYPLPLLRYLVERSQCHILVENDEGYLNQV
jgi:hypothetical protein